MAMPNPPLPFDKLRRPEYPPVHPRKGLSRAHKLVLREKQGGLCAGCGKKPKRWEWDHVLEVWEGGDSRDLTNWQGFGSRTDCACHKDKTAASAARRAKMNRLREITGQVARRRKNGPAFKSRPMNTPEQTASRRSEIRECLDRRKIEGRGFAEKPQDYVSPLSKAGRRKVKEKMEATREA